MHALEQGKQKSRKEHGLTLCNSHPHSQNLFSLNNRRPQHHEDTIKQHAAPRFTLQSLQQRENKIWGKSINPLCRNRDYNIFTHYA